MAKRIELTATVELIPDAPIELTRSVVRPVVRIDLAEAIAIKGRKVWERFHTQDLTVETLAKIEAEIPAYGCSCSKFYSDFKKENPFPIDGDDREKFAWTVSLHNAVNRKLGKDEVSVEEAWKIWRDNGKCDRCGLCCVELSVVFNDPRLPILKPAGARCEMQSEDGSCSIHDSKPDVCKRFVAGGFWCNEVRRKAGLEPL